ncbi:hypothetical protein LBMAG18_06600 [Alphaproteobacteria bacterium]|nr:hypothetical protein LBMAG18_06600 [Alphaproteobacteria bacterium]
MIAKAANALPALPVATLRTLHITSVNVFEVAVAETVEYEANASGAILVKKIKKNSMLVDDNFLTLK